MKTESKNEIGENGEVSIGSKEIFECKDTESLEMDDSAKRGSKAYFRTFYHDLLRP